MGDLDRISLHFADLEAAAPIAPQVKTEKFAKPVTLETDFTYYQLEGNANSDSPSDPGYGPTVRSIAYT